MNNDIFDVEEMKEYLKSLSSEKLETFLDKTNPSGYVYLLALKEYLNRKQRK